MIPSELAKMLDRGKTIVELDYPLGATVYLKLRDEELPGMVVSANVYPGGIYYRIGWGNATETTHYAMELTDVYEPTF